MPPGCVVVTGCGGRVVTEVLVPVLNMLDESERMDITSSEAKTLGEARGVLSSTDSCESESRR